MHIEGDLNRDGACCVRGVTTAEYVDLAREAIDANLADLSPGAKRASGDDDGAFIEDFCSWQRIPAIERFARESGVAYSLVHATQFFEFVGSIADISTEGDTVRLAYRPVHVEPLTDPAQGGIDPKRVAPKARVY